MSRFFPMDPQERYLREQGEIIDCAQCGRTCLSSEVNRDFLCAQCAEEKEEENNEQ